LASCRADLCVNLIARQAIAAAAGSPAADPRQRELGPRGTHGRFHLGQILVGMDADDESERLAPCVLDGPQSRVRK
jgi:hypothetical protein